MAKHFKETAKLEKWAVVLLVVSLVILLLVGCFAVANSGNYHHIAARTRSAICRSRIDERCLADSRYRLFGKW